MFTAFNLCKAGEGKTVMNHHMHGLTRSLNQTSERDCWKLKFFECTHSTFNIPTTTILLLRYDIKKELENTISPISISSRTFFIPDFLIVMFNSDRFGSRVIKHCVCVCQLSEQFRFYMSFVCSSCREFVVYSTLSTFSCIVLFTLQCLIILHESLLSPFPIQKSQDIKSSAE